MTLPPIDPSGAPPPSTGEGRARTETALAALALLLGEGWAMANLLAAGGAWSSLALIHLAAATLLAAWFLTLHRRALPLREGVILLVCGGSMGPFGAGGFLVMLLLLRLFRRQARDFLSWYLELFPEEERSAAQELAGQLLSGRAKDDDRENVASFNDFLVHGSPSQKQAILALLARSFRPAFAPSLRAAKNDEDATVRVMAATAVSHIENRFQADTSDLQERCQRQPEDYDLHLKLAFLYDDYAFTGLLDPDREADNRRLAGQYYRRCAELRPDSPQPWQLQGRLHLRAGETTEAITCFEAAVAHGQPPSSLSVWLMEAHFQRGEFERVRELANQHGAQLEASNQISEETKRSIQFWMGGQAA